MKGRRALRSVSRVEPADSAQIAFYLERARGCGGSALELGCGTGVISVALALAGIPVWAFDDSRPLVERALERREAHGLSQAQLRVERAQLHSLRLGRRFRSVHLPSNSLLRLADPDEVVAVLATARAHLAPGGLFALDVRQAPQRFGAPSPRTAAEWRAWLARRPHLRSRASGGRPGSQHKLRLLDLSATEIDAALDATGLAVLERWGGFGGEQFGPGSDRMVVVATPA